jgi:Catalytic LigB subunit of aromatic ring-opening dioxygenase
MPIQMAAASSHAPSLFFSTYQGWELMHHRLNDGHPQPPETALENEELIAQRVPRIKENFARLKSEFTKFKPDAIISVLGDQREWFDGSNIPNLLVYTGPDAWTVHNTGFLDEDPQPDPYGEMFRYPVRIDQDLANTLLKGLLDMGFDAAYSTEMDPQSQPKRGIPHGIGNVMPHSHPDLEIPIVPLFVNVDDGPPVIMNGERCVELGRAIAKICEKVDKRILITGSGGMSHDPRGLRSGWVDEPQDHWFLEQMHSGNVEALKAMFSFRSELFRGGGGELRTWIVAAAAMDYMKPGHKAAWSDYIPARKVTTGSGWVYYPPLSDEEARAKVEADLRATVAV